MAEVIIRRVPGHYWVRLFISPRVEPGHAWMYRGIIRRDAWRIGPVGFGIMRLVRSEKHWERGNEPPGPAPVLGQGETK